MINDTTFRVSAILTGTSSCLSILGASLIFITYWKINKIRNVTRKLLVFLTTADLLTAVGNLVAAIRYFALYSNNGSYEKCNNSAQNQSEENDTLCVLQSFVTTFSNMSSFLWTLIIAIHLWASVVLKTNRTEARFIQLMYHIICWVLPLVIVSVIAWFGYLGEDFCVGTGVWCGIKSNLPPKTIEICMWTADIFWQITCYVTACFLYIHLKVYLMLRHRHERLTIIAHNLRDEDQNFVFVWMIIYLLKLWGMTRFFVTTYGPPPTGPMPNFLTFLLIVQSYGASGQAFWNSILFCLLDKTVRLKMKEWLKRNDEESKPLVQITGN